ncbi:hypothetical protein RRG08_020851 [Elysia crispata]|uniref:Uncharacterized protein n=1 Tax=Elysia crispata TaxID=231223 RepID=A0AAE1CMG6_9GAST|nr:hypothetical protein RRG08_020851 [Elysia crispata]
MGDSVASIYRTSAVDDRFLARYSTPPGSALDIQLERGFLQQEARETPRRVIIHSNTHCPQSVPGETQTKHAAIIPTPVNQS